MSIKADMIGKTVLKDYVIEEYLGSGSYGDVYKASQTIGKNTIHAAIKRLMVPNESDYQERLFSMRNDRGATDHYFRELHTEIVSEIAVMHQLAGRSSNIVAYFQNDIIEHHEPTRYEIFIAMEYLTTLNKYCLESNMPVSEVLRLGIEICSALEVCHSKGIMHRDIKESNIFVNDDKQFKLGDFGLAKVLSESSKAASNVGSLAYKAPEVAIPFSTYDKTVDIYSLGIVLFKMFNYGRIPFAPPISEINTLAKENEALRKRFSGETVPAPQQASKETAVVIQKACAPKPEDRYQTATEFKMALQLLEKQLDSEELKRAVVIPSKAYKKTDTSAGSANLSGIGKSFGGSSDGGSIFDSEEDENEKKDCILWEQAQKEGTEKAMREYLKLDNSVKAFSAEAWKWLDEYFWNRAVTESSVAGYEQYLKETIEGKRYVEHAEAAIRKLNEKVPEEPKTEVPTGRKPINKKLVVAAVAIFIFAGFAWAAAQGKPNSESSSSSVAAPQSEVTDSTTPSDKSVVASQETIATQQLQTGAETVKTESGTPDSKKKLSDEQQPAVSEGKKNIVQQQAVPEQSSESSNSVNSPELRKVIDMPFDGGTYTGTVNSNELPDGYGEYKDDSWLYMGSWKNGEYDGNGYLKDLVFEWYYTGEFKNGNFNGHGTYTMPDGSADTGTWVDGQMQ